MDRPLWQIILSIMVVSFVVGRIAAGFMLHETGGAPGVLWVGYALQSAAGIATAAGIWLGRRWVLGALAVLWVTIAGTGVVASAIGAYPPLFAMRDALVALVATGFLYFVLRHEFGTEGSASE